MDPVMRADDPADLEARRMELRGTIRLASEVIAQYWPMRTFVHHNPLHSLEYLPFTETVRRVATNSWAATGISPVTCIGAI
jgi:uncharacterized protein YbcC (UPF0753/DUF2309 family)